MYLKLKWLALSKYISNFYYYGKSIEYQPKEERYIIPYQFEGQSYLHISTKRINWDGFQCLPFTLVLLNDEYDLTETFRQLLGPDRNLCNIPEDFVLSDILRLTLEMTRAQKRACYTAGQYSLIFYMEDGREITIEDTNDHPKVLDLNPLTSHALD